MATHSSIPAWRIPWTEEPGRLESLWCKELDKTKWLSPLSYLTVSSKKASSYLLYLWGGGGKLAINIC